jgi:tetratricopeptide (TPR) repeat protein
MSGDSRVDRLLDAIELVEVGYRPEAYEILRELIREDNDFEHAWLWMSVAVGSFDESEICLENVLRVNPDNFQAAGALYRMRETEMLMVKRRDRYRLYRDLSLSLMWLLVMVLLYGMLFSYGFAGA